MAYCRRRAEGPGERATCQGARLQHLTTAPPGAHPTLPAPVALTISSIGLIISLLSLPVVLLLDGPFGGWVLAVGLWLLNWVAQMATNRLTGDLQAVAAVGLTGISLIARAWMVVIILFIVALQYSKPVALTAAGVFMVAFTFDLLGRTILQAATLKMQRSSQ